MPATEAAAAELFDDIDVVYFLDEKFDSINYELQVNLISDRPIMSAISENDWNGA
jgi:hypothetical protein